MTYRTNVLGLRALVLPLIGVLGAAGACSSSSSTAPDGGADSGASDTAAPDTSSQKDTGPQTDAGLEASTGDTGSDAVTESDTGSDAGDAGSDAGDAGSDASDAGSDGGCSGATPIALTVYNYKAWCALTVAGTAISPGTPPTTTETTVCVAAGATLSAEANGASFEIGPPPLPFMSGTNTVTDPTSTEASTTLATGATCVFACCPFSSSGSGCSGLTNPCP